VLKSTFWLVLLLTIAMILTGCNNEEAPVRAGLRTAVTPTLTTTGQLQPAEEAQSEAADQAPSAIVPAPEVALAAPETTADQYGLIAGRVDDRSINQLAWGGMQRAARELGLDVQHLESHEPAQVETHISQFLQEGYTGIVTVGFELAPFVRAASAANPSLAFINVDFPSQTSTDLGLLFETDQPAFMAGYLAGGMSQTGTVCTYGGRQLPPVMIFMVGFESGLEYYNQTHQANVQLLGWQTDPQHQLGGSGTFIGSFSDQEEGRRVAESFFDQGCDIIFPVAGAAGLGAAQVAQARGLAVIGVDADMTQTAPEFANVYLTSVLKRVDQAVFEAIRQFESGGPGSLQERNFRANYIGTLANNGVGLAPFHSFEAEVSQQLKDDLVQIRERLIAGTLLTGWPITNPIAEIAEVETEAEADMASRMAVEGEQGVTLEDLRNAEYKLEYAPGGRARLVNGQFRAPAVAGAATETVIILSDVIVFGDLNGDGSGDAAAVLISDPGGSGTFYDLAAVVDQAGEPVNVATTSLGDRLIINELRLEGNEIVVDMVTTGPTDPLCCPSQHVIKRYKLEPSLVEQEAAPGTP
jgi:basic membrane protein A